mgnify:CR=1 FL=1
MKMLWNTKKKYWQKEDNVIFEKVIDPLKNPLLCSTVIEIIDTCLNMYRLGWDEINGGNISVILTDEEV